MAKLIDLMRQAGVQWPEGAEYAAQDADDLEVFFYREAPFLSNAREVWEGCCGMYSVSLNTRAEDWRKAVRFSEWLDTTPAPSHLDPDEQQRIAARRQERHDLVRELMLRHPELTGQQAIAQADAIIDTLEGLRDDT